MVGTTGRVESAGRDGQPGGWPWPAALGRWLFGRKAGAGGPAGPAEPRPRFRTVCISREAGAGGGAIGRAVADRLGWKFYDAELLEAIARLMEVPIEEVRALDELAPSVVQDWILPLREEYYAPLEAYLDHLAKLLEAIGRSGKAVVVGRGAAFHLPRSETLSVRIVAPIKYRAARIADRMGVSPRTARRAARDLDRRRAHFDRTLHRVDAADAHNYDLVLDAASIGPEIAAQVIVRAVEAGMPPAPTPPPMLPDARPVDPPGVN